MGERRFDLIGIDGDDTLWHNERDYVEARERFVRMIEQCGVAQPARSSGGFQMPPGAVRLAATHMTAALRL